MPIENDPVGAETRARLAARLRREIAENWKGGDVSVVDELIAERRAEAAAEDASW